MFKNKTREIVYEFVVGMFILLIYLHEVGVLKNPYFTPDEIGYWASGAWMNHIDWSPIFSHTAYYGWGYGIILAPLFAIKDVSLRFCAAIIINIFLMLICYFLLISIMTRLIPLCDKKKVILISACGVLYSYYILYAHLSMCEIFLTFLFILSVRLIISIYDGISYLNIIALCVVVFMMVATHLRMLIIPIVLCFLLISLMFINKISKKYWIPFICLIVGAVFLAYTVKDAIIQEQYTANVINNHPGVNDSISMRLSVFRGIIEKEFWVNLFYSTIGKLFYLGGASFFTFFVGVRFLLNVCWQNVRKIKDKDVHFDKSFGGIVYITLVFLASFALDVVTTMQGRRYDHFFYGRYIENIILVIICLGIFCIIERRISVKEILTYCVFELGSAIIMYKHITSNDYEGVLPLETAGFAGFFPKDLSNYGTLYTIYVVLIVIIFSVFIYIALQKKFLVGIILLGTIWTIVSYRGLDNYIYPTIHRMDAVQETANEIINYSKTPWTIIPQDTNEYITAYVDILWLQFHLSDNTINVVEENNIDTLSKNDVLIINRYYPNAQTIAEANSVIWQNERFYLVEVLNN